MNVKHLQAIRNVLNDLEPKQKALPYLELDSMMLAQVVEVAKRVSQNDINPTHVQNWVRRKYLPNPLRRKYSREQVANILLINDLRDILSLEEVSQLLGYVNQSLLDTSDDRINPTKLYRYYSETFDCTQMDWEKSLRELEKEVEQTLSEDEMPEDDREKVETTLVILNLLARANLYKQIAKRWLNSLET
ncbi:hypothetical protein DP73_16260 [Desulfosporosinus sp. HMP52]|uniref:DUF1836 domain-containing protein n=1 Tax=Desulfosporosinus sp. HMP52 TaxID=1487923 RepID=UPI00051F9E4A|nr:DUF1836 domain-containing protein [Desulfosporosinus sp. HMP52]KGK86646.1 hypothetical protein DP73_16260 [Desulfosporosinus sp. HMP52]